MMSRITGLHHATAKLLLVVILLSFISGSDCFYDFFSSKTAIQSTNNKLLSDSNLRHPSPGGVYNASSEGGSERQGKLFFGGNSRLFGARRRIQFALLPIMYKLGVISTMLVGLTVMVLKGLSIGVILLFFALGNAFLKYKTQHSQQPVHFHLHPGDLHSKIPVYHNYEPSGPWDKTSSGAENAEYETYDPAISQKKPPYKYPYRYHDLGPYSYYGR